jgi:hypothetical protein
MMLDDLFTALGLDALVPTADCGASAAYVREPPLEAVADIGTPFADAAHWHEQDGAASCAVVAQGSILEEIRGIPFDEQAATAEAQAMGWFDPTAGTPPWAVGELLEAHGVPCTSGYGATLTDLADALARGDKVIVGLNANEIWTPVHDRVTGAPLQQDPGGHAVWVTGLDAAPDGSVHVLLNDSGTAGGRMESVEVHDFLNAWADHDGFMVVADA